jgi:hypothetical protein
MNIDNRAKLPQRCWASKSNAMAQGVTGEEMEAIMGWKMRNRGNRPLRRAIRLHLVN